VVVFALADVGQDSTEDIEMLTRKSTLSSFGRVMVLATVSAVALTALEPSFALAAQASSAVSAKTGTSDSTDFSAARRRYYGGGGAAAAAAFAGIVGTGLAIAAAQNRRDDYYYGGPAYYGGGPVVYGGGPAYYGNPYGGYYGGGYGYRGSSVPYFHGHPLAGW
jgi:hypothetical protein